MRYQRLLNKEQRPGENEIIKVVGETSSLWLEIHEYVRKNFDFSPELVFFTKKYGWAIRYRKSGKTLGYFFPEDNAFSILLVLGGRESERVDSIKDKLEANIKSVFENTEQLHDGRWLWIRILTKSDVESVKLLLHAKQKPEKAKEQ
jgi:hypothetical protein